MRRPASAVAAAEACGLGYSEEFNRLRWSLEEAVDPATQKRIPMPERLNVPYLTKAQMAKLSDGEAAEHLARRAERIHWAKQHWMRVPCWGGLRPPGAEWTYDLDLCSAWRTAMRGGGSAEP